MVSLYSGVVRGEAERHRTPSFDMGGDFDGALNRVVSFLAADRLE